jgi:hypothetical protein
MYGFTILRTRPGISWMALIVVLTACKQQPNQMDLGIRPNTNWKGTLADLLPPIDDIESITLTSEAAKFGEPPVTRKLQDSERRLLIESFANTRAVLVDYKYEISGEATIVSRNSKAVRLRLLNIQSTNLVYLTDPTENAGPPLYFIQLGNITPVLDLLPNSLLQKGKRY